jgi:hypothetical protein
MMNPNAIAPDDKTPATEDAPLKTIPEISDK